jgi:hypothetical protein
MKRAEIRQLDESYFEQLSYGLVLRLFHGLVRLILCNNFPLASTCVLVLMPHFLNLAQNTPTLLVAEKSLVGFLAMKQTLLVSYCRHLAMYLSMKLHGQSVASHPLMQKLLEMRTILEKVCIVSLRHLLMPCSNRAK